MNPNAEERERLVGLFAELVPLPASGRQKRLNELTDGLLRQKLESLLAADDQNAAADQNKVWETGLTVRDGYKIEKLLGRGGQGEVYRARLECGLAVALKRTFLSTAIGQIEKRAVELLRTIQPHPHLVSIHRFWFIGDDELVVAMDLAETNLRSLLEQRVQEGHNGLDIRDLLRWMKESAEALDYLHSPIHGTEKSPVVHRDIKPDNLLLCGGSVKVGDYGLLRSLNRPGLQTVTRVATLGYDAPEARTGRFCVHSDQYSLATTYVQLRTGQLEWPPQHMVLFPGEVDVINKARHAEPEARYRTCGAFVEALVDACPLNPQRKPGRQRGWIRLKPTHGLPLIVLSCILIVVLASTITYHALSLVNATPTQQSGPSNKGWYRDYCLVEGGTHRYVIVHVPIGARNEKYDLKLSDIVILSRSDDCTTMRIRGLDFSFPRTSVHIHSESDSDYVYDSTEPDEKKHGAIYFVQLARAASYFEVMFHVQEAKPVFARQVEVAFGWSISGEPK